MLCSLGALVGTQGPPSVFIGVLSSPISHHPGVCTAKGHDTPNTSASAWGLASNAGAQALRPPADTDPLGCSSIEHSSLGASGVHQSLRTTALEENGHQCLSFFFLQIGNMSTCSYCLHRGGQSQVEGNTQVWNQINMSPNICLELC